MKTFLEMSQLIAQEEKDEEKRKEDVKAASVVNARRIEKEIEEFLDANSGNFNLYRTESLVAVDNRRGRVFLIKAMGGDNVRYAEKHAVPSQAPELTQNEGSLSNIDDLQRTFIAWHRKHK